MPKVPISASNDLNTLSQNTVVKLKLSRLSVISSRNKIKRTGWRSNFNDGSSATEMLQERNTSFESSISVMITTSLSNYYSSPEFSIESQELPSTGDESVECVAIWSEDDGNYHAEYTMPDHFETCASSLKSLPERRSGETSIDFYISLVVREKSKKGNDIFSFLPIGVSTLEVNRDIGHCTMNLPVRKRQDVVVSLDKGNQGRVWSLSNDSVLTLRVDTELETNLVPKKEKDLTYPPRMQAKDVLKRRRKLHKDFATMNRRMNDHQGAQNSTSSTDEYFYYLSAGESFVSPLDFKKRESRNKDKLCESTFEGKTASMTRTENTTDVKSIFEKLEGNVFCSHMNFREMIKSFLDVTKRCNETTFVPVDHSLSLNTTIDTEDHHGLFNDSERYIVSGLHSRHFQFSEH